MSVELSEIESDVLVRAILHAKFSVDARPEIYLHPSLNDALRKIVKSSTFTMEELRIREFSNELKAGMLPNIVSILSYIRSEFCEEDMAEYALTALFPLVQSADDLPEFGANTNS